MSEIDKRDLECVSGGASTSQEAAKNTTYTVQSGDTLWDIAVKFYKDGTKYTKIFNANKDILKDPDHIYPGQVLKIP